SDSCLYLYIAFLLSLSMYVSICSSIVFFFYVCGDHRDLHSFPTRRSSDLGAHQRRPPLRRRPRRGPHRTPRRRARHRRRRQRPRSEEHTSELQSRENLVCRLLLEKKNNQTIN